MKVLEALEAIQNAVTLEQKIKIVEGADSSVKRDLTWFLRNMIRQDVDYHLSSKQIEEACSVSSDSSVDYSLSDIKRVIRRLRVDSTTPKAVAISKLKEFFATAKETQKKWVYHTLVRDISMLGIDEFDLRSLVHEKTYPLVLPAFTKTATIPDEPIEIRAHSPYYIRGFLAADREVWDLYDSTGRQLPGAAPLLGPIRNSLLPFNIIIDVLVRSTKKETPGAIKNALVSRIQANPEDYVIQPLISFSKKEIENKVIYGRTLPLTNYIRFTPIARRTLPAPLATASGLVYTTKFYGHNYYHSLQLMAMLAHQYGYKSFLIKPVASIYDFSSCPWMEIDTPIELKLPITRVNPTRGSQKTASSVTVTVNEVPIAIQVPKNKAAALWKRRNKLQEISLKFDKKKGKYNIHG